MAEDQVTAGSGTTTLVDGLSFVISDDRGDINATLTGLIVNDVRYLSTLRLTVDGSPVTVLSRRRSTARDAQFHGFVPRREAAEPALECVRRRTLESGLFDSISLRWWDDAPIEVTVRLELGADFADIFEVRNANDLGTRRRACVEWGSHSAKLADAAAGLVTAIAFDPPPDHAGEGAAEWRVQLIRDCPWILKVAIQTEPPRLRPIVSATTHSLLTVASDPPLLAAAVDASLADFRRLRFPDPSRPGRHLVAAGIPWFVALFGRDSLIAAYQARGVVPELLIDTLEALSERIGVQFDQANDEAPGKILHEVRLTDRSWLGEGTERARRPYFGSSDSTPLFLIMIGVALRWGVDANRLRALEPATRAALAWLRGAGDVDGDGFIEYSAGGPRSLRNQGWKDSEGAIQFANGVLAEPPIALVEIQGYAYRARRESAEYFSWLGDAALAQELNSEADELRSKIRDRYWISSVGDAPGYFALGLDRAKRPIDAVSSNMGHLLWCGVPSNEEAEAVAHTLLSRDMLTGAGIRTLSRAMSGYNPISYHVGSVWPHDTLIIFEGLRRYGLVDAAMVVADQLLNALDHFEGRLPELYSGHASGHETPPVPYPTACRPQAWAAGVPFALVTALLGVEPSYRHGEIEVSPVLPPSIRSLRVDHLQIGSSRLGLEVDATGVRVNAQPEGFSLRLYDQAPRIDPPVSRGPLDRPL